MGFILSFVWDVFCYVNGHERVYPFSFVPTKVPNVRYELSETLLTIRTERTESAQVICVTDFLKPVISFQMIPWLMIWYVCVAVWGNQAKKQKPWFSAYIILRYLNFRKGQIYLTKTTGNYFYLVSHFNLALAANVGSGLANKFSLLKDERCPNPRFSKHAFLTIWSSFWIVILHEGSDNQFRL